MKCCKCKCSRHRVEWGSGGKWFLSWDAPNVLTLSTPSPGAILNERDALALAHCLMEAAGKCQDYAR